LYILDGQDYPVTAWRPMAALLMAAAFIGTQAASAGVVEYGYVYASRCPGAGLAERVDRWHMYMCNCTSYVAWALSENGQRTDWFIPGAMDARNWAHVARLRGIPVGTRARVGAVAVWQHGSPLGHVAYVTRVDAGGRFDVAEYNLPGAGDDSFAFDTRTAVSPSGAVFVYVPMRSR
jgi:surface antigen